MSGFEHTNYHDHVALHRLNSPQTVLWLLGGETRRRMAANLVRRYPSGLGVLSATLHLIAYVNPRGGIRELPPPHRRYQMHEISNQPTLVECQCASFYDPESGGPWRDRQSNEHHPMCQFEKFSIEIYDQASRLGTRTRVVGFDGKEQPIMKKITGPEVRPDEWMRLRSQIRSQKQS